MCTRLLRGRGYTVLETANGEEAFRLIAPERTDKNIHLLLSDVVMPKMSGVELATHIGLARPDIKILLMSGYTEEVITSDGCAKKNLPFLAKPFLPEGFLHKVREVLDS